MKLKNLISTVLLCVSVLAQAQTPKYIFYYIGDGMGMGPLMAAENYNRTILGNDRPLTMLNFPVASWSTTYSASSLITDSAAAGTALATGHKTNNNMLGVTPDTIPAEAISKQLQSQGYGIGVITTVAPDDATPGAFFAHVPDRKMFEQIDRQMAASGFQFVSGTDLRGTLTDGKDNGVLSDFAGQGVQILYGPDGIADISAERVLLLNTQGHPNRDMGCALDSIDGILTLPMITRACLYHLMKTTPDRFFMMVEGGSIDHALHANDGATAVKEIINFDQALEIAFDFYRQHPDETLIVVTADHDTGGMSTVKSSVGDQYTHMEYIDSQKVSKEVFNDIINSMVASRRIYTWDDMRQILTDSFGFYTTVPVSEADEARLKHLFDITFVNRDTTGEATLYAYFNALTVAIYDIFNRAVGFGYTTSSHSGNPVPVFAIGVGADRFATLNDNTTIPATIMQATRQ